jgi:hypothetical protein
MHADQKVGEQRCAVSGQALGSASIIGSGSLDQEDPNKGEHDPSGAGAGNAQTDRPRPGSRSHLLCREVLLKPSGKCPPDHAASADDDAGANDDHECTPEREPEQPSGCALLLLGARRCRSTRDHKNGAGAEASVDQTNRQRAESLSPLLRPMEAWERLSQA